VRHLLQLRKQQITASKEEVQLCPQEVEVREAYLTLKSLDRKL